MIIEINPHTPEPRKVRRAVAALEAGEIIAYPTDTVYALGCDLANKKAIDRLYQVKGMNKGQPLAFICPDLADLSKYAVVDNVAYRLLRRVLPGPYTFVLTATREVPKMLHTSERRTVGIRGKPQHSMSELRYCIYEWRSFIFPRSSTTSPSIAICAVAAAITLRPICRSGSPRSTTLRAI